MFILSLFLFGLIQKVSPVDEPARTEQTLSCVRLSAGGAAGVASVPGTKSRGRAAGCPGWRPSLGILSPGNFDRSELSAQAVVSPSQPRSVSAFSLFGCREGVGWRACCVWVLVSRGGHLDLTLSQRPQGIKFMGWTHFGCFWCFLRKTRPPFRAVRGTSK